MRYVAMPASSANRPPNAMTLPRVVVDAAMSLAIGEDPGITTVVVACVVVIGTSARGPAVGCSGTTGDGGTGGTGLGAGG